MIRSTSPGASSSTRASTGSCPQLGRRHLEPGRLRYPSGVSRWINLCISSALSALRRTPAAPAEQAAQDAMELANEIEAALLQRPATFEDLEHLRMAYGAQAKIVDPRRNWPPEMRPIVDSWPKESRTWDR